MDQYDIEMAPVARMTDEQNALVLEAMKLGISCGLDHPFEWLYNATGGQWLAMMPYADHPGYVKRMEDAFVALYAECEGPRPIEAGPFTSADLCRQIDLWRASFKKPEVE
jgi:hypothetical protein